MLVLLLGSMNVEAQNDLFVQDTSFKVFANGNPMRMGFSGGFNTPQTSQADLNNDGKNDLIIYEKQGEQIKTFINYGVNGNPDYRYEAKYAANFPYINSYLALLDYNCDGIADLFHRGVSGYTVYRGYFNASNQLCFQYYRELWYPVSNGWDNAYCDPSDVPGIADIDGDGDLDFLGFSILGSYILYYRNLRVEQNLPCDSIRVELADKCWGKIYQGFQMTQTLGITCAPNRPSGSNNNGLEADHLSESQAKTTLHTGNHLCFLDYDGDGDMDYLNGGISYSNIQFLKNGKKDYNYPKDTIIAQDTMFQTGGFVYNTSIWPAAFWVDVDQDGKKDIVISPTADNVSENKKCFAWYRNTGTTTAPIYTYKGDSLFAAETIDMGTGSRPMLYDYDRDGKLDLFIGSDGFFTTSNGNLRAKLAYYRNTSTVGNPSFTLVDDNFLNIYASNVRGAYPAIGDLDNDGKDNLIVAHANGKISYYTDTAALSAPNPGWKLVTDTLRDENNVAIDSTQFPMPFIYDMDGDGKKDLIIGSSAGWLYYYKNNGNAAQLKLKHITSKLGLAKADPINLFSGYASPFIGKVDSTNVDYLLLGSSSGAIYRYTGFQNGNLTTPFQLLDTFYSNINRTKNSYSGFRSAPAVADLDGDGKMEMVLGNILGGVYLYKKQELTNISDQTIAKMPEVFVFPNPFQQQLNVKWKSSFATAQNVTIELYSLTGQMLAAQSVLSDNSALLSLQDLPAGFYLCLVKSGANKKIFKVVKQ